MATGADQQGISDAEGGATVAQTPIDGLSTDSLMPRLAQEVADIDGSNPEDPETTAVVGMVEGELLGVLAKEWGYKEDKPAETKTPELTPEQAYLSKLKTRFDSLPQLHQGIEWADVEKSLIKDPEAMRKLQLLDEKGHNINVFGEENGEFVFVSGWSDYSKVSPDHRNIAYDLEGQKLAEKWGYNPTGNSVDIIKSIGVEEADPKFHRQLIQSTNVNGLAWLKTDAATRKSGGAFGGCDYGFLTGFAYYCDAGSSFRAELKVKKA